MGALDHSATETHEFTRHQKLILFKLRVKVCLVRVSGGSYGCVYFYTVVTHLAMNGIYMFWLVRFFFIAEL